LSVGTNDHYRSRARVRALNDELIALQYPNGRVYETALGRKLAPGDQFDMYGRRWMATPTKASAKASRLYRPRTLCVPAGSAYV
jgi:hypothetical protein